MISWWEKGNLQWHGDEVCFVLDQQAQLNFLEFSPRSLKRLDMSTPPRAHYPHFELTSLCFFSLLSNGVNCGMQIQPQEKSEWVSICSTSICEWAMTRRKQATFTEMMMMLSAMYCAKTLNRTFTVLAHWNNHPGVNGYRTILDW
jgi:hypothetical protein